MAHQSSQFEQISLAPVILAELFSQSLVIIDKVSKETPALPNKIPETNYPTQSIPALSDVFIFQTPEENMVKEITVNRLGDFNKNVLVLVNDNKSLHLADAELELLGKMLQAIKLSFADIAIVNVANQGCTWENVHKQLPPKQVILFGVDPARVNMPVRFPDFRVQQWSGISFLFSPALAEINQPSANQVLYKKELWRALQEMFSN